MGAERLDRVEAAAHAQRLIAERLRESAAASTPRFEGLSPERVAALKGGDIALIEAAGDLVSLPISSHRALSGSALVALKRALRRLLHPLPEAQSRANAANARVATLLLHQLAEQARAIERLEAELAELRAERRP